MTFRELLESDITVDTFIKNVTSEFKKHFPNGFIQIKELNTFGEPWLQGIFGMIGNPKDNTNGIIQNDKMRHTFLMNDLGNGTYSFKGSGKIYIKPEEGSYNAMDSIKTKLGNNSKITLKKAEIKLDKFFKTLSSLMKENKDKIYGVKDINKKYLIFK